jgi:hypothetical protein
VHCSYIHIYKSQFLLLRGCAADYFSLLSRGGVGFTTHSWAKSQNPPKTRFKNSWNRQANHTCACNGLTNFEYEAHRKPVTEVIWICRSFHEKTCEITLGELMFWRIFDIWNQCATLLTQAQARPVPCYIALACTLHSSPAVRRNNTWPCHAMEYVALTPTLLKGCVDLYEEVPVSKKVFYPFYHK